MKTIHFKWNLPRPNDMVSSWNSIKWAIQRCIFTRCYDSSKIRFILWRSSACVWKKFIESIRSTAITRFGMKNTATFFPFCAVLLAIYYFIMVEFPFGCCSIHQVCNFTQILWNPPPPPRATFSNTLSKDDNFELMLYMFVSTKIIKGKSYKLLCVRYKKWSGWGGGG